MARRKEKLVTLYTLRWHDEREEYIRTEQRIALEDLPPDAVHVSGCKGVYLLDEVRAAEDRPRAAPEGCQPLDAIALNLYMTNNAINDAMAFKYSGVPDLDIRKLVVYGFAGMILLCVVYAML